MLEVIFAMIGGWRSESGLGPQSQWSLMKYCGPCTSDCLELPGGFACMVDFLAWAFVSDSDEL